MYVEERLELILKDLNRYGKLNVKDLSEKFKVTPMTIRRDLSILEEKGLLLKSYGGALSKESLSHDKLYSTRKKENLPVKKKIAAEALLFIKNGMTILLDAGTTNYELAKFLVESSIKDLVIITNDLKIACVLAEKQFFQIVMLGGIIENENILTCGSMAVSMLKDFEIDACFVGTQSISNKFEIRTPNIAKVELKKTYIEKSQQRFLLTDSSKFEKSKLYKICDLKDFHYIITDKKMNLSEKNYIKKYKIAWVSIDP
ncbi:DeoR/GlpR transcriptional regulator [Treponema putidum]|uniref:DeoR/GlpR family DNA-binding transcription regulator n=1 Tax=Treponema putidum TaxID=221027 RepID=UPI0004F61FF4|nr:DeoR/GlpR family DNA-binding transcription regulator [Treponema putidum]AIN94577.1 hypothetical protein JO40_11145 [Treponema putidum]TWI78823.1 DeoR family transcriptional regulator [Treponema putidum]